MRICTFSAGGASHLGLVIGDHVVEVVPAQAARGLTPVPDDLLSVIEMGRDTWDDLEQLNESLMDGGWPSDASWVRECSEVRFEVPFLPPKNPWTVGSNYLRHLEIAFARIPREVVIPKAPEFFTKALTAVCGDGADIVYDKRATVTVDYENELMIVIGVGGKNIPKEKAMEHIFGFSVANDVSAREIQMHHGQFYRGKSQTGFCPFGPVVATQVDVPDPNAEQLRTWVNGELRQDWPVGDMIFKVDEIVSWLSQGMTIEPGDVIICGTAPGVGFEFLPQKWLQHGDVVECEISGIGRIRNTIKMAGI